MRARFLIPALAVLLLPVRASADTYPRQPGIDAIHYVFRLSLMPGANTEVTGETTVAVRVTVAGTREVALDLASPADGKGMTVSAVTSAGQPLKYTHVSDRLTVTFAAPPRAGEHQMFTVNYRGTPAKGLKFLDNIHGEPTVFSENWPNLARHWLPTIDHPYDKASGELIVTTGAQYQVVANGALVAEVDLGNGRRETHWKQSVPIASWLYALGIARFSSHTAGSVQGVPVQTWVFPQDRIKGEELFEALSRRVLSFYIDHIGPYLVREARQRAGGGRQRRHGARHGNLLRRKGSRPGPRTGGPRDRTPVVGKQRHRARLG